MFLNKSIKYRRIYIFIISFTLIFLAEKNCIIMDSGDDAVFKNAINSGIFQWLIEFYLKWSGRLVVNFLEIVIINCNLFVWKLLNALVFSNLVYGISKLIDADKHRFLIDLLIVIMILAIPIRTFSSASLWITGSFNYLWPVSFAMPILNVIKKHYYELHVSKKEYAFSCVSALIACYNEQVAAILMTLLIILVIYKVLYRKKINTWFIGLCIFLVINSVIMFMAPGNYVRSSSEMIQWNSSFNMLSIFDKIWLGIYNTMKYSIGYLWYLLILVPLLSFYQSLKKRKIDFISFLSILYILLFFCLRKIISLYPCNEQLNNFYGIIYNIEYYNSINFNEFINWFGIILSLVFIIFQMYIVLRINYKIKDFIWMFLVLSAAFTSSIIMGFTPTIIASGSRIFFVMTVLIVYAIIYTVSKCDDKIIKIFILIFMCYFSCKYMNLYLMDASYLFLF